MNRSNVQKDVSLPIEYFCQPLSIKVISKLHLLTLVTYLMMNDPL